MFRNQVVVVLGARSGSSALSGTLGLLGCALPAHLMPANYANPKGYFEPQNIADAHDALLAEIGSSWHDVTSISDRLRTDIVKPHAKRLKAIFQSEYSENALSVLKEPRICRLLPIWEPIFRELGVQAKYLFIDRHPVEVARSLRKRDASSLEKGLLYYSRNHLEAETDTRGEPRAIISFDSLLQDWRSVVDGIEKTLDITFQHKSDKASEIDSFLETNLRNQNVETAISVGKLGEAALIAEAIHIQFARLALIPNDEAAMRELGKLRERLDALTQHINQDGA